MNAAQLPKGQSGEGNGDGRPKNEPGIWHHPGADVNLITQPGNDGVIQADALKRVGYVRVADVPDRTKLLKMQKAQLAKDLAERAAEKKAAADAEAELVKA